MPTYRFVPIVTWPRKPTPAAARRRSPFSAKQTRTLADLVRELDHLGARSVVIQTHHPERDLRLDGMPKASARDPENPGVILSFTTGRGDYSYPCDTYTTWTGNLRAIVLTLEHLRAVERYGVTTHGEQYHGWKALPPAPSGESPLTPERAAEIVACASDGVASYILRSAEHRELSYRKAANRLHPDRGGSHEAFVKLQQAIAVLRGGQP